MSRIQIPAPLVALTAFILLAPILAEAQLLVADLEGERGDFADSSLLLNSALASALAGRCPPSVLS